MMEAKTNLKIIDLMIERMRSIYSEEYLDKPVIGLLTVADIIVNYITQFQIYPDKDVMEFLIQTIEDELKDKMYELAIQEVESIIKIIES